MIFRRPAAFPPPVSQGVTVRKLPHHRPLFHPKKESHSSMHSLSKIPHPPTTSSFNQSAPAPAPVFSASSPPTRRYNPVRKPNRPRPCRSTSGPCRRRRPWRAYTSRRPRTRVARDARARRRRRGPTPMGWSHPRLRRGTSGGPVGRGCARLCPFWC